MGTLVNVAAAPAGGAGAPQPGAPAAAGNTIGVFTTTQSVLTFPVASGVVTIIWQVIGGVFPSWGKKPVVALVIALLMGTLIWAVSTTRGQSTRDKLIGGAIAIINSFSLAATALGIHSTL
jgi:hypothetical protein